MTIVEVEVEYRNTSQSFYRGWIRKSFPVGREGLTVLKSILPCWWWQIELFHCLAAASSKLHFEGGGEQHFPMVVFGRGPYILLSDKLSHLPVHRPQQLYQRTGFRYSHRLRAGPTSGIISDIHDGQDGGREITWSVGASCRKDGRVTQADRGQPVAGSRREITKTLFVFFILKNFHWWTIIKSWNILVQNCLSFFQSRMNSWWVDPWVWCSI